MNSRLLLCVLARGGLSLVASPARAEGTFDIPAGARFNQDKLAKVEQTPTERQRIQYTRAARL